MEESVSRKESGPPIAGPGIDAVLAGLMSGMQAMVGTDRFAMALQSEGRKGAEAEWPAIAASPDFETGFARLAESAAVGGWGTWSVVERDDANKTCTFRVSNGWEARCQRALGVCWGSATLAGRFAGYCTRLYGTNCWADQTAFEARGDAFDEFVVHPSPRTVDEEVGWLTRIDRATRADLQAALDRLQAEIEGRRLAEEKARMLSAPIESILDSAGVWLHVADAQGRILLWNRAAEQLSGFTRERVTGRSDVWTHLCPETRTMRDPCERLRAVMENHPVENLETQIRTADGNHRVLLWHLRPLSAPEGPSGGSLGMALDITEKKAAERALRLSEERLRLALEGTTDGLWDWDIPSGRVHYSTRCFTMFGFEPESLPAHIDTWRSLMHPDDRDPVEKMLADYLAQRADSFTPEHRIRASDGSWRWIHIRGRIVARDPDGTPVRMSGTIADITDRKRDEAKRIEFERYLLHAQKLESMGLMAGGIAHDFNNLLMAILGNLDIALSRVPGSSPASENIRQAIKAAERSADLTRQMLAYSGKGHQVVKPLDLGVAVRNASGLLRSTIPRSAELVLHLAAGLPVINADEGQLSQVILNLVSNAGDALAGKPGRIEIATSSVAADEALLLQGRVEPPPPPGAYVCLDVRDNGAGMDEPTCEKFLDPFFSTKAVGRGLGMAAVLGIVRGHHGTILVESAPGRGTRIQILLPAAPPATTATQTASGPGVLLHGHMLVVDDEDQVRITCGHMLETLGMTCTLADCGPEAIRILREDPSRFTGVLLDLSMPGMDGFTTLQELRRIRGDLRIVLISGYDQREAMKRFGKDGPAGFIQKPFNTRRLGEALSAIFG